MWILLPAVAVLLTAWACSDPVPVSWREQATPPRPPGAAVPQSADLAPAILAQIEGRDPPLPGLTREERSELHALYRAGGYQPQWLDSAGRPGQDARVALALLGAAAEEGLDPSDYHYGQLERLATALEAASPGLTPDVARFEVGISSGLLRYLHHLHAGRVDPRAIGLRLRVPADHHDFAKLLRSAREAHQVGETAAEFSPPLDQYRALRAELTRYRALGEDAAVAPPLPAASRVRPGEPYEGLDALHRRLVAFGDLPAATPAPGESARYEGALVEGVKRFQLRHGLEPDGVLGQTTFAALRTPIPWRIRQIELALERLRWLPHLGSQRLVLINIPMFHLWAWDSMPPDGLPSLNMDVIVGRALGTETPVFVEYMREVIFRPYWNVPPSILLQELLPIIERDPDYLQREDLEIVRGAGDDARPVDVTAASLAPLRQGVLRLRQRPGPRNALGLIKFVFPNEENVYMHGTPAQALFARSRRDFSHGCVRVADPISLAAWALGDPWTREGILAAMAGSASRRVALARPIQVILFYTTAAVMPEDGMMRFAEDIYGHDVRLDRALTRGRDAPP